MLGRLAALLFGLLALVALPARAQQPLVADLSKHLVAITTGFAGTEVLLFGAVDGPGDVVVVVRGPAHQQVIRRKERVGGIFINRGEAKIPEAPAFYAVAATRALEQIGPKTLLERHQIGVDNVAFSVVSKDRDAAESDYRQALIRLKQRKGLYGASVEPISMLSNRLFRTEMHFPANVPVGTYMVEIYLIDRGQVVSAQTTPLMVSKIGVGAEVFDFAHQHAAYYGIVAVILAAAAGWLAATAFRKG